jgi:hypothetical protein
VISFDVGIIVLITKEKSSVILNLLLWSNFFRRRGRKFGKFGSILLDIDNVLLAVIKFLLVVNVLFVKYRNISHGLQGKSADCSD